MRCGCGFVNATDARFCGRCRTPLQESGAIIEPAISGYHPPHAPTSGSKRNRVSPRVRLFLAICFVALAGGATFVWLHRLHSEYGPDRSGLYEIERNGKFGFMDRNGNIVIDPTFDRADPFSEGRAAVGVGDKVGYIDVHGKIVITPQFFAAGGFRFGRAVVKVCCGGSFESREIDRYGIIDSKGMYVSPPTFRALGPYFANGLIPAKTEEGTIGLVDTSGRLVTSGGFGNLAMSGFHEGLASAGKDGRWGYIDPKGSWIVQAQFDNTGAFSEGFASVKVGERWGYIDRKGRFVVNPQYDGASDFNEGRAAVSVDGQWGFIDSSGQMVIKQRYLSARDFHDGLAAVQTGRGWAYINRDGDMTIIDDLESAGDFDGGLAKVRVLGTPAYIRPDGTFVNDPFRGTPVVAEMMHIAADSIRIANEPVPPTSPEVVQRTEGEQEKIPPRSGRTTPQLGPGDASGSILMLDGNAELAIFSRGTEGRIEYTLAEGFPTEGTLEMRIDVTSGYEYADGVLSEGSDHAVIFTTTGPDAWYPGSAWLRVFRDGKVEFSMSDSKGGRTPLQVLSVPATSFRYDGWHIIGISFGSRGRSVRVDGTTVAHDDLILPLAVRSDAPPTIGEYASRAWPNNRFEAGFEGRVSRVRFSKVQEDWVLQP